MKKLIFLFIAATISANSYSQKLNELTWFGVDFSKAKMVGSSGFSDPAKIQSYYLNEWNNFIVTESDKYDVKKYFKAKTLKNSLDLVKEHNDAVDAKTLVIDNAYTITEEEAKAVVQLYKGKGEGTGLVFVVESFSKTAEKAFIYAALFDISTGNIIKMKKLKGNAGGFGFRNYWLAAIRDVMQAGL